MKSDNIRDILHNLLLREYHDQYRIPFKEFGGGHAFVDEFIDWIQYSSPKGTLPKPSIKWEDGIKKGCEELAKKKNMDAEKVYEEFMSIVEKDAFQFDKNGNLYVERAITMRLPNGGLEGKSEQLYNELIVKYEKNVGGCWAYKKGMGEAYCGSSSETKILFKGYMFLDDVFWPEFIRLELRDIGEYEIRTKPNGRIQLMEIVIGDVEVSAKSFDGPRILNSTFFGNNQKYNDIGYAKLGYNRIGYDKKYIDRKGKEYTFNEYLQACFANQKNLEDIFDTIGDFVNGFAIVTLDYKYNLITSDYKLISPEQWFDKCYDFGDEGFAAVEINGKWNFIDKNGEFLFKENWVDYARPFKDGFGVIKDHQKGFNFVNASGEIISPNQWFQWCDDFSDGMAMFEYDGKVNYVGEDGQVKFPNQWFDTGRRFYFGVAAIGMGGKFNYITKNGQLLSPDLWFDNNYSFEEGFGRVVVNDKWNLIDADGKFLSPDQWFDNCKDFAGGVSLIELDNEYNYIKTDGTLLSPDQWFEWCTDMSNNIAQVKINGTYQYINIYGKIFNLYDYDSHDGFREGFCRVVKNDKYNFVNMNGDLVSPNQWYDHCTPFRKGVSVVSLNGNYNYMDMNGEILQPNYWFEDAWPFNNAGYALVKVNGTNYYIDKNFNFYNKDLQQLPSPMKTKNESFIRRKKSLNEVNFSNLIKNMVMEEIARYYEAGSSKTY